MTQPSPGWWRWFVALATALVLVGMVTSQAPDEAGPRPSPRLVRELVDELRFPVPAATEELRFSMWWEQDEHHGTMPTPREFTEVPVDWALEDESNAVISEGRRWHRMRTSWVPAGDGLVSNVTREEHAVGDTRSVFVDVAGHAGSTVVLRRPASSASGRLWVLAHKKRIRSASEKSQARGQSAFAAKRARLAGRLGVAFEDLSPGWQDGLIAPAYSALAPLGDAPAVRLATRSFVVPREDASALGVAVWPGQAVAFNLADGATLEGQWLDATGQELAEANTWLQRVSQGIASTEPLGEVSTLGPWTASGVVSIQLALDAEVEGPRLLRMRASGPSLPRVWGDPPRWGTGPDVALSPDFVGVGMHRAEGEEQLTYAIDAQEAVRVDLRQRLDASLLNGFGPATSQPEGALVEVRLGGGDWLPWLLTPRVAPFERYIAGDHPSRATPAEPERLYLPAQAQPTVLEVRSTLPVDVVVKVQEPGAPGDRVESEYVLETADRGRYVPYAQRGWRVRAPVDSEALTLAGRTVAMDAITRLAGPDDGSGSGGDSYRSLALPPPFDLVSFPAEPGAFANRLRLGSTARTVQVGANQRIVIDYRVARSEIGKSAVVTIDGEERTFRIRSGAGRVRFERVPRGSRSVSVDVPGLFLAEVPGDYVMRRVWRIAPGASRTIAVPEGAGGLSVKAVSKPTRASQVLSWSVVGAERDVTLAARSPEGSSDLVPVGVEAEALSFAGGRLQVLDGPSVRFEERLHGAPGFVTLQLEGSDVPVWVWLTSTWGAGAVDPTSHWPLVAP